MGEITVKITAELEPFRDDLEYFFNTMVRKLHTNRHKGTDKSFAIGEMRKGAYKELEEVEKALAMGAQFEVTIECADVANFAFLLSRGVWGMSRAQFDDWRFDFDLSGLKGGSET